MNVSKASVLLTAFVAGTHLLLKSLEEFSGRFVERIVMDRGSGA